MSKQATAERILEAAATLFAERGYIGTTTSAIAHEAGVNEVTLFRHFESKVGIARAIGATFEAGDRAYPPPEAIVEGDRQATLRNLARLEIEAAVASGGMVLRLAFDARTVPELREAMGQVSASNVEQLSGWLADAQELGEVRSDVRASQLAEAFYSLTSTLVMSRIAMGSNGPTEDEIEALAEDQMRLLWSGIGPRED